MENYPKIYLYRRIVQAKLFIDEHYSEEIDLANISDEAHFSKFHFIRLFKNIYGFTPHQYLTYVRIEKAKIFLADNMSVADTCSSVGFSSISSFTGLFRKHTGQSPSEFQRLALARKRDIALAPLNFIPNCFAESNGWKKNSNFQEVNM